MGKFLLPLFLLIVWTGLSRGQTSSQPEASGPAKAARFAPGTKLRVELDKTLDAKKARPGDPILAKTIDELKSGGEVIAPRGSRIVGHVVSASPHEKGSPSRLEIVFDTLELEHKAEIPMKATVEALARPVENTPMGSEETGPVPGATSPVGPGNRGGMPQGVGTGQPAAPNVGTTANSTGASGGTTPQSGKISPNAEGVMGMSDIALAPGPAQDSLLTSEKHNVKLESGTQMIVRHDGAERSTSCK